MKGYYSTNSALHRQLLEQAARRERERKVARELELAGMRRDARRRAESARLAAEGIGSIVDVRNTVNALRGH